VLSQNKKELLSNWWNEGKLEASEEMGDLVSAAGGRRRRRRLPRPRPVLRRAAPGSPRH
jgi:hypothetical protein